MVFLRQGTPDFSYFLFSGDPDAFPDVFSFLEVVVI